MKNTTKAVLVALVIVAIVAIAIPATAVKPVHGNNDTAPPMLSPYTSSGSLSGRITTSNGTVGLPFAYVAIVNAANHTQAFYEAKTDANGFYQFNHINNTMGWAVTPVVGSTNGAKTITMQTGTPDTWTAGAIYQVYANSSVFGEGTSVPVYVTPNDTQSANVVINPVPAKIVVTADRTGVIADGVDHVKISAYATDVLTNAVPDGTLIDFAVNNSTIQGTWDPNANGSLSNTGNYMGSWRIQNVPTVGGWANVSFGWVNETYSGNNSTIIASYAGDYSVNASINIYFNPTLASWFGSVVDSYNKPYGGVVVTLHLMGYINGMNSTNGTYEVYNMTTTTNVDLPYPGSFVIDNIELNSSIAYGYASAQADVGDGITYYGYSDNYTMNKSRTSSGFIVLHVPQPDAIKLTPDPDTILVGGDTSIITAQLYLNGKPYKRSGVQISFFDDNDTIGFLPAVKTNISNADGKAAIILTSNQTKGDVNVTGFSQITRSHNLTDTCVVHVVGWGTISGMVTDKNKNGIPNATVKLWTVKWANDTYENQKLVKSPENPQQTVSRPEIAAIGTYTYYMIPSGIYNLTAEKADSTGTVHMWFAIVNLTVGTATNNVALPDFVVTTPVQPTATPTVTATPQTTTATPTPTATATAVATPTATPSPSTSPGFELAFALVGLLGVAYLIMRKEH